MSDNTNSRFPHLGKLSLAIIENWAEPVLGKDAISAIKSPLIEKELLNSIVIKLSITEQRFIKEHSDQEVCNAIINLPLANLPSVIQAARDFYTRPTNNNLENTLNQQLANNFVNLEPERLRLGVSTYLNIFRQELAILSSEIRDKLSTEALLNIQINTERITTNLEQLVQALSIVANIDQEQEYKKITYNRLLQGLKERRNNTLLGDSVYEAEALYAEGKLPDELIDLLSAARDAFDEIRARAGRPTSAQRLGDLRSRKKALDEITGCKKQYIYDEIYGYERPTIEVLQDAAISYEMASEETAQHAIDTANKLLNEYPFRAAALLRDVLNQPLLDQHQQFTRKRLDEIEHQILERQQSVRLFIEKNLSQRQRKIVELAVTRQWNYHQIASELQLSPTMVNIQLQKICQKLQTHFGLELANVTTLITFLGGYW